MKNVLVLTTSRADFSIYTPVLKALSDRPDLSVALLVTGMHMSEAFGATVYEVRKSPWPIAAEFECLDNGDAALNIARSMGRATSGAAEALSKLDVDLLVTLGDRFEMLAAALAAVPMGIPVAHIHGGEETEGAMDNVFRHMLTKMSHLHFCATDLAAQRVRQMGETPERIFVSGAPALDHIASSERMNRSELTNAFGVPAQGRYALVTYHPVTLDLEASWKEFDAICDALDAEGLPAVFTAANADTAGCTLNEKIKAYVSARENMVLVPHFGAKGYYSAMAHADVMIGNSSSGILEAASLSCPVINVGDRQKGRERSGNTIDVAGGVSAIAEALAQIQSPEFREGFQSGRNVYGKGEAGLLIAREIAQALQSGLSVQKHFAGLEA